MSDQANVRATEAIASVKSGLAMFAKQTTDGLSEIEAEIRRSIDWLEHDRPRYWKERVRRAWDGVTQAKVELQRCLSYQVGPTDRPSCTEQRAALKKAQERLRYCEEKQQRVRRWAKEAAHELHEYQGRVSALATVADADVPQAAAALERMLLSIEKYAAAARGLPAAPASRPRSEGADKGTTDASGDE